MRVWSVMVKCGALDRYDNSRADEAADFGRRRVWPDVPDARRNLSGVCRLWCPVVLVLHRFFIAISRSAVNRDDSSGFSLHPLVWSAGGLPKKRRTADVVRDVALLPGPLHLWDSGWVGVPPVIVTAEDVFLWPYSVDILVKLVIFWVLFIGPLLVVTWVLEEFPMCHLDSTLRARATTLGYRISAAVPRVHSVAVLPLDSCGRLRIFRTMHLPAALHGVEASLVSISGLRKLRSAFGQAAMSGGLRLANPGAVLSLLDGLVGF